MSARTDMWRSCALRWSAAFSCSNHDCVAMRSLERELPRPGLRDNRLHSERARLDPFFVRLIPVAALGLLITACGGGSSSQASRRTPTRRTSGRSSRASTRVGTISRPMQGRLERRRLARWVAVGTRHAPGWSDVFESERRPRGLFSTGSSAVMPPSSTLSKDSSCHSYSDPSCS